jgi:opacity protein-like surface antigen
MRKYVLATTVLAALASPAFAAASGPYVGIEGGVTFPQSTDLDVILNNNSATPTTTATYGSGYHQGYNTGYDVDLLAGYKLGLLRLEVEGGYKRSPVKNFTVSGPLLTDVGTAAGVPVTATDFSAGDHIGVTTLMANALLDSDFGGSRLGGYVGGGIGEAWASYAGAKDNAMAYQGIVGLRYAVSDNIDAGLKYRYLHTDKLNFDGAFAVNGTNFTTTASGNYDSHSVLASLVYNFNSRAPEAAPIPAAVEVPPPPPAAPSTQTCPDGSVILATSACPAPPPPPPPAPAPAERGERGR